MLGGSTSPVVSGVKSASENFMAAMIEDMDEPEDKKQESTRQDLRMEDATMDDTADMDNDQVVATPAVNASHNINDVFRRAIDNNNELNDLNEAA